MVLVARDRPRREHDDVRRDEARDVVHVAVGVVADAALAEPDRPAMPRYSRNARSYSSRSAPGCAPGRRRAATPRSRAACPAPLASMPPPSSTTGVAGIGPQRLDARQPGDALRRRGRPGVGVQLAYFAQALKRPVRASTTAPAVVDEAVGAESRSQTRSVGTTCRRTSSARTPCAASASRASLAHVVVVAEDLDGSCSAMTRAISAYTHGIGPSFPGQSGSWCGQAIQVASCALPLGGHPVCDGLDAVSRHPRPRETRDCGGLSLMLMHRGTACRIGAYASMRRSRRNGQLRRVLDAASGRTARPASLRSSPASASMRPNGSAMNEWPKNSMPWVPGSSSCPTRLGDATYTPFAMACERWIVRQASTCAAPNSPSPPDASRWPSDRTGCRRRAGS